MKTLAILPLVLALAACGAGDNKPEDSSEASTVTSDSPDNAAEQSSDTSNGSDTRREQLYSITSATNGNGTIIPGSQENIEEGQNVEFMITPDRGFDIQQVSGCDGILNDHLYSISRVQESCEFNVVFSPKYFTINTLVTGPGALTPESSTVVFNDTSEFEIRPGSGQRLSDISGCNGKLELLTYTTSPMTGDCVVSAQFSPLMYTVTTSISAGGTVSPVPASSVSHGSTVSFKPVASDGYRLSSISGCDGNLTVETYITAPVNNDCIIEVSFEPLQHTVTLQKSGGGSITPELPATYSHGQAVNWSINTEDGFEIGSVSGCEGVLTGSVYSATSIESDCEIIAEFNRKEYTISREVSTGGTITANNNGPYTHNDAYDFTIQADDGYELTSIEGCDGTLKDNIYTTGALASHCKIIALFEVKQYAVVINSNDGGFWSPTIPEQVEHGSSLSLVLSADTGYSLSKVEGCDGVLSGNTFTIQSVEGDCDITIEFEINTYIIRPYANSGGAVEPYTDITLAHGETATYQVLPSQYYYLKSISGCDGTLDGQTYTVGPARAHCRFTATFERIKYSITPDLGYGGSITPDSAQSIYPYSFAIFTIQPDIGYKIDDVSGCPGERSGNRIKVTDMTGNCSLTVTFERITAPAGLNDTGVNWSGDNLNDNNIDCTSDIPGGQDCNAGRDALNAAGLLVKTGAGSAGFDYTKLDAQGLELSEDAEEWSCVRDNHTGLEWEVKTDTGPRAKADTFRWYNTTLYENGGNEGDSGSDYEGCYGYDPANTLTLCNTQAYISRINATGLCGHSDWRLPDIDELRSIVDFGRTNPTIDTEYFPNTMPTIYWSSSPSTWYGTSPHPENSVYAWALDFNRGFDTHAYPPRGRHVRLVRRHSGYN